MSGRWVALLPFLGVVLTIAGYAWHQPEANDQGGLYHTSGPLQGSLIHDRPVPIYSPDRVDPWNRIYHLLFTRTTEATVPRYYQDPTTGPPQPELAQGQTDDERLKVIVGYYHERFLSGEIRVRRLEGGDIPDFFFGDDVSFITQDPRYEALAATLAEELRTPHKMDRSVEQRVLFQQDLWNRFDALHAFVDGTHDELAKARARRLLDLLGQVIGRLAPKRGELQSTQSNFSEVAQAHPDVVDPRLFSKDSHWRELVVTSRFANTTAHAVSAGYRRIFRVFVRIPDEAGGAACLEAYFRSRFATHVDPPGLRCLQWGSVLGDGSRALLVETVLALSNQGEIVPVPLVVNIQSREIRPLSRGEDGRFGLEDLPFLVLHGSRQALSSRNRQHGGLKLLAADEPVPRFFAAFGRRASGSSLVPARFSCTNCHGLHGANLMTTGLHGITEVRVLHPENTVEQERVIRAKESSPEYQALKRFFATN